MSTAPAAPLESADYVVVGAGSAGCVLADRLSADPAVSVLLIEAGGPDGVAEMAIPAAFPRLFGTAYDWAFTSAEQPELAGRGSYWPRGKTLGGSSSINAQIWTRGHSADYDGWAATGLTGWSAASVAPYFRRAEDRLGIQDLRVPNPTTEPFLAACHKSGLTRMADGDDAEPDGYGSIRVNHRNGRRWSSADAYLRPALKRPNLSVITSARADRVVLAQGRAVGVEVSTDAGVRTVTAAREVILAAGAVGSPHLLMLSGIGDPQQLTDHGIPVEADRPAVGGGLADHLSVPLALTSPEPVSPGIGDQTSAVMEYFRTRSGKLSSNLAEAVAWVRSDQRLPAPDIEFLWMPIPFIDHGRGSDRHGLTLCVVLLQPASRGRVSLRSADPKDAPLIEAGYLSDPDGRDLRTLIAGIRQAQHVLAQEPLLPWLGEPMLPGVLDSSEPALTELVRTQAQTLYHPVGTCRMGTDEGAVLDPELRVRGVTALRVADASALPTVPRAHTHAPTVMLAERAADLIRTG